MTRCAIYIRRSRKDKNNPGHRLEYQRQVLPEYAKSQGWETETFDEGMMSASDIRNLVQLNKIISRMNEFQVILAIDFTRFSRDASAQDYIWFINICAQHKIKLATPQEIYNADVPASWLQLYFKSGLSAFEIQQLKERLRQGKQVSRDKGIWQGGIVPFGYQYNRLSKRLILDKKEATLILKICQYLIDHSMSETVRKFAKHKTKRGVPIDLWWVMKISSEHRLRFYCGMMKNSKGEYIQGQHPAIISDKLRREVLTAKAKRHKEGAGFFGTRTLFGGLKILRCGFCGSPVVVRYVLRYPSGSVDYYNCALKWQARKDRRCKEGRYFQCRIINEVLSADLIKTAQDVKTIKKTYADMKRFKNKPDSKKVLALSNELEQEEHRKKVLVDLLGSRLKNDNDVIAKIEEVKHRILELDFKLRDFETVQKPPFDLEGLKEIAKRIENFRNWSRDKKREIIKLAIKQVRFFREYLEVDYTFLAKPRIISLEGVCRNYTPRSGKG